MKTNIGLIPIFTAAIAAVSLSPTAFAALTLVNGNFESTTGYTPAPNANWRNGTATGWTNGTPAVANDYKFNTTNGTSQFQVNLEALSSSSAPFYQNLGTLDTESTITLTFALTVAGTMDAAIWSNGGLTALATLGTTSTVGTKTLTVSNVAAGTAIRIGFWDTTTSGNPMIDNVTMSVVAVPEPHSALLGGLGVLALLRRRRN